jgi:hypothetical protein
LRKSLPARAAALGFVALIIFGNLWVVYALINAKPPVWISYGFGAGLIVAMVSGVALGALLVYWRIRPPAGLEAPEREEPHG